jgi:hypothetical protein
LFLIVCLVGGCSTTPESLRPVEVFREGTTPTREYKDIGTVYVSDWAGEEERATEELIIKARERRADAIIMLPRVEGDYKFNAFGRSGRKYTYKAIIIVWK